MIVALCAEFLVCEIGKGEVKQQSKMDVEAAKLTMYRSMKTQIQVRVWVEFVFSQIQRFKNPILI